MSRTGPEQSKAKLRDAELAEAERQLMEAHQQLAAMKAEMIRSNRLLEQGAAQQVPSRRLERPDVQFDGFASASALRLPASDRTTDAS